MKRMKKMIAVLMGSAGVIGGPVCSETETSVLPSEEQASPVTPINAMREDAPAEGQVKPVPPGLVCEDSADRRRSLRLDKALSDGFGVQYWGEDYNAEALAERPHGLLIIEAAKLGAQYSANGREEFFSPDEIKKISRDGARPVLAYLNISEIEEYRDYWVDQLAARRENPSARSPEWFGPLAQHGDRLAAFWLPEWRDVLLERVDRLMSTGANGIFLDDLLHYYTHSVNAHSRWPSDARPAGPTDAAGLAQTMMDLVVALSERVRAWDCDAYVVVNNGVFIGRDAGGAEPTESTKSAFADYLSHIDGILVENVLSPVAEASTREVLKEDFLSSGLQVMTIDNLDRFGSEDAGSVRYKVAVDAAGADFHPYLVDESMFSRLSDPIRRGPQG